MSDLREIVIQLCKLHDCPQKEQSAFSWQLSENECIQKLRKIVEQPEPTISEQLFSLANQLSGDKTGHLGAIVHSVVSELNNSDVDAFSMIANVHSQMELIRMLKGL